MKTNSWPVIFFAGTSALLVIYLVWWGRMITDPKERTSSDFIALYSAGRIAQAHGFTHIYNIELQQQIEQEVMGFKLAEGQVLLYNHMPYLVPFLSLVVDDNYVGSFQRWVLVLIFIYFIGTLFFVKSLLTDKKEDINGYCLLVPLHFSRYSSASGRDRILLFYTLV